MSSTCSDSSSRGWWKFDRRRASRNINRTLVATQAHTSRRIAASFSTHVTRRCQVFCRGLRSSVVLILQETGRRRRLQNAGHQAKKKGICNRLLYLDFGYDGDDESSGSCLDFCDVSTAKNRFQKSSSVWQVVQSKSWQLVTSQASSNLRSETTNEWMVLEPKFTDYGSIHSAELPQLQQHNSSHALLSPRSVHSLPPLDAEEPKSSKGNMLQGDLYQRQPLLPGTSKNDKRNKEYFVDEDEENILHSSENTNGHIRIEMPLPPPIREEPRFPQEKCKTFIASIVSLCSFLLTLLSLSIIHDKVPDRNVYAPLPDVILNVVPAQDWALDVSEYIIMVSINTTLLAMLLHKHRFIVFRRIFLVLSLLYMYRAITMFVTVLPVSSTTYYCSPKSNDTTPLEVTKRIVQLFSGFGLSVNGKHTYCGDFIYSGHTVVLVFSYLFMSEYTPKKLYVVHWIYWLFAVVGVCMVQLSHGHYTVDVIIAYYITTRIFWIYHTLANNPSLKQHSPNNHLGRLWWFSFFLYFEGNVSGPVPRQWPDWPLPWPRRFLTKSRES